MFEVFYLKLWPCSECCIPSFGWFPDVSILWTNVLEHCPIFVGGVSMKNNWDEIARIFILVKVWLKIAWTNQKEGGMGRGCVRVEEQAVEAHSKYVREKRPVFRP